jgi:DNA polymerase-3 subunit gamma/tau
MSYLVLARKYRPKNFSEMVGQSHVVQALGNALSTQRLHHAYLFTGTRGVGKTTVSRILAKSLNCTGPDGQGDITATPCGVCQACMDIDSGRFVDYTELDAASNRGVDEIAQLLEQAVYKPVIGRFKVFMIDEVHMLTNTAFNAMLKTLEEPPAYLKFVLATTDPQKVPATVLSRCLQFNLRPMAPETILEHLVQVLAAESVPAEPQALRLLARAARGSMRDALSLTDQAIAFGSGSLAETGVRQMLGSVDRSYVYQLLDALARGDGKSIVELSEVLRLNGFSAASTLEEMTTVLQRMAVLQAVPGVGAADDATDPDIAETARLAQLLPADETQLLYSLCLHGRGELGLAPDEYAALTMVLLRLLPFKRPVTGTASAGGAAEPLKKPQAESPAPAAAPAARPALAPTPAPAPASVIAPAPVPAPASAVSVLAPAAGLQAPRVEADSPLVSSPASAPMSSELGDAWAERVQALMAADLVAGLVRELALQSELQSQEGGVWTLQVESQSLNHAGACDKLLQSLQALPTGAGKPAPARLQVVLGPVSDTPARRLSAAQTERQRLAEEVIAADPFVQDMVRQWGARIVPGSVRPLATDVAKPI